MPTYSERQRRVTYSISCSTASARLLKSELAQLLRNKTAIVDVIPYVTAELRSEEPLERDGPPVRRRARGRGSVKSGSKGNKINAARSAALDLRDSERASCSGSDQRRGTTVCSITVVQKSVLFCLSVLRKRSGFLCFFFLRIVSNVLK